MSNQDTPIDPWASLSQYTSARIALGRVGSSLPTRELLKFSTDHAEARDAVHSELDMDAIESQLRLLELKSLRVKTQVATRHEYLQRPDLGRKLTEGSRELLRNHCEEVDVSITIADGLSAFASQLHACRVLKELVPALMQQSLSFAPVTIVQYARVAVQDEIGQALGAKVSLILIGERPGLGTADSLGAYLVFNPNPTNTDANRNCISNIRPAGLSLTLATQTIAYLLAESLRRKLSGVQLKDDRHLASS